VFGRVERSKKSIKGIEFEMKPTAVAYPHTSLGVFLGASAAATLLLGTRGLGGGYLFSCIQPLSSVGYQGPALYLGIWAQRSSVFFSRGRACLFTYGD